MDMTPCPLCARTHVIHGDWNSSISGLAPKYDVTFRGRTFFLKKENISILSFMRRRRDSNPRDLAVGSLVNCCNSHYATPPKTHGFILRRIQGSNLLGIAPTSFQDWRITVLPTLQMHATRVLYQVLWL